MILLEANIVAASKIVLQDELKYEDQTLLTYRIEYPEFRASRYQMCLAVVNKFYRNKALEYKKRAEEELFNLAVEQYKEAVEQGYPIRVFEVIQEFEVTYSQSCIISLYMDQYEYTGGAHGATVRQSQTWNLQKCGLVKLCRLVQCPPDCRDYIFKKVEAQIAKHPDIYFENYRELIRETFNENSFYCTPRGIVVYYQQYDIAPYASGIREFEIPYSNCVMNPARQCFAL